MKAFDPNYKLLDEMYQDDYYPAFLVDKVKDELQKVIDLLESGETDTEAVQEKLDEAVCGINDLQDEFYENDSEIETVARDCIGANTASEFSLIPPDNASGNYTKVAQRIPLKISIDRVEGKEKLKANLRLLSGMSANVKIVKE